MISNLFAIGFALLFACAIAWVVKENEYKLTLRGRRVVFFFALILGLLIAQFVMHFYVDCDLRAGATTPCQIGWIK